MARTPRNALATIVIPTLDRPDELDRCLRSLDAQTEQRFDVKILREKGPLASIRNQGLWQAKTEVVVFIDDDVVASPGWLAAILRTFQTHTHLHGVSGPATIPLDYRVQRDLFRYRTPKRLYDEWFCEGKQTLPGHLTRAGAWTTGACEPNCYYEGRVDFLEACNMAFRTESLNTIGGFDEAYAGIGDWSEPDAALRLRSHYGDGCLYFTPGAALEHHPSRTGAYRLRRADSRQRLANYDRFARRWVTPCLQSWCYRRFLGTYYWGKSVGVW